jgi:hypothetical protein
LENEAFTVQVYEDRWEEEGLRRGRRGCRRGSATDVSTAARSEPRVEEVKDEDRRSAGSPQQRVQPDPYPMEKSEEEIPMFVRFAERGLALPASDFFKGLLGYYGVEYVNLNPNGIFHTAVFIHFCEALLGIKPH